MEPGKQTENKGMDGGYPTILPSMANPFLWQLHADSMANQNRPLTSVEGQNIMAKLNEMSAQIERLTDAVSRIEDVINRDDFAHRNETAGSHVSAPANTYLFNSYILFNTKEMSRLRGMFEEFIQQQGLGAIARDFSPELPGQTRAFLRFVDRLSRRLFQEPWDAEINKTIQSLDFEEIAFLYVDLSKELRRRLL